jgi:hypothetical protein
MAWLMCPGERGSTVKFNLDPGQLYLVPLTSGIIVGGLGLLVEFYYLFISVYVVQSRPAGINSCNLSKKWPAIHILTTSISSSGHPT